MYRKMANCSIMLGNGKLFASVTGLLPCCHKLILKELFLRYQFSIKLDILCHNELYVCQTLSQMCCNFVVNLLYIIHLILDNCAL